MRLRPWPGPWRDPRCRLRSGLSAAVLAHARYPVSGGVPRAVSRYRQGAAGQDLSRPARYGPGGCDLQGSGPSPAAGVPLDRCGEGQRGVDLGEGGPDGRGLAVCLAEQLGCLCGGFLGLAEVLFCFHWPSSCLIAWYWGNTARAHPVNWPEVRNAEARPAGDRALWGRSG
jgi:hypothetical protein